MDKYAHHHQCQAKFEILWFFIVNFPESPDNEIEAESLVYVAIKEVVKTSNIQMWMLTVFMSSFWSVSKMSTKA